MKKEKSQRILQKYKTPCKNTMNNYMAMKLTMWKKYTTFQNLTAYETKSRRSRPTEQTGHQIRN